MNADGENPSVICTAVLERAAGGRQQMKGASVRLLRNEHRDLVLEIEPPAKGGRAIRLELAPSKFSVHNRFAAEGKASVSFVEPPGTTLLLSNAPPADLLRLLKTIFVKSQGTADAKKKPVDMRSRLLSSKPAALDDISPVTKAELARAKAKVVSKATATTPSPSAKKKADPGSGKKLSHEIPLNEEQRRVMDACVGGANVFFTGSAGTGKSFLLRRIVSALPPDTTVPTASTGVAACHISGTTLHAFAGIGSGDADMERCLQTASKPIVAQKWRKCKTLIIDEISMVHGKYFEKIERVARHVRKNDKPFGGIQLILCGDFLQLPPVTKNEEEKRFCFQTEAWHRCIQRSFELKTVHRQKDAQFVSILNDIRIGRVTDEITKKLNDTARQNIEGEGILATRLCTHTGDSDSINKSKLNELDGEEIVFNAHDSEPHSTGQLDAQTIAPSRLALKRGAQVMLLKNVNVSAGLVNGARGVVVRFEAGLPVVRFRNKREYVAKGERWVVKSAAGALLARQQIPLNLAWAFSIHKSQGLTLDCVEMSLSKIFEAGQAYVALSRAQSLESLRVLDFNSRQVWANPKVLEFYQKFRRQLYQAELLPLGRPLAAKKRKADDIRSVIMSGKKSKVARNILSKPLMNIC